MKMMATFKWCVVFGPFLFTIIVIIIIIYLYILLLMLLGTIRASDDDEKKMVEGVRERFSNWISQEMFYDWENDFKPKSMIEGWMMMMMTIIRKIWKEPSLIFSKRWCCHKANHICIHHHYRKYFDNKLFRVYARSFVGVKILINFTIKINFESRACVHFTYNAILFALLNFI